MNILITGASKGIGKALVKVFSQDNNHRIIAVSRSIDLLKELESHNVIIRSVDITNEEQIESLVKFIGEEFETLDVLINNAGLLIPKSIHHINKQEFKQMMQVNFSAPFFLIQQLLPFFKSGSHIVNISSMGGYQGSSKYPGLSVYSSAKAAIAVLSECLAVELAENKISVNALALGATQTEMLESAFPDYKAPVTADQMANYIANFALEGQQYFNGQIIPVTLSNP